MIAEPDNTAGDPENAGDHGADPDDYLRPKQQNAIVASMLNPENRYGLKDKQVQYAVGVTIRNMGDQDGRVSNGAVSNFVKMMGQVQADDHKTQPDLVDITMRAQIVENPNFYGNAARIAALFAASAADSRGPEQIQVDDLRAPLGENGNRPAGDS